jgi:hypothetical protein
MASLWLADRLPELGPGKPDEVFRDALSALTPDSSFENLRNQDAARACISGLWLYHDFLDESHTISQDLSDSTGSYWHGIMHRREPDPGNAKYWFRKVGPHPVLLQLETEAPALGYSYQNPLSFVDFCERVRGTNTPQELIARQVQLLEMHLLFDWCYHKSISG